MHIGVYLGAFSPDTGGGYTMQADILSALCEGTHSRRHRISVYYHADSVRKVEATSAEVQGLEMVPIPKPGVVARVLSALRRNSYIARILLPRINRLEGLARKQGVQVLWFAVGGAYEPTDIPYIATVWDIQHRLQPWFPEVGARGAWEAREITHARFLQRAAFVVTGTLEGQRQIERFYQVPSQRIRVLPLPTPGFIQTVAARDEKNTVLKKFGLKPGFLFYPAQFWAHKNHVNLILALSRLRGTGWGEIELVFTGSDKGNQAHVRAFVEEHGLSAQVRFLGFVEKDELIELYRNALAVPFVTFFGPDNLPPLEAFALGCPVIASDIPGAKEQLGDAALYVDPTNPDDIAHAIERIRDDSSLRSALLARGRVRAAQWTARDYVRGMVDVFDQFENVRHCWPA